MNPELQQALEDERNRRAELNAARDATNRGGPMYVEARAESRWQSAYCRVRELEGTTHHE